MESRFGALSEFLAEGSTDACVCQFSLAFSRNIESILLVERAQMMKGADEQEYPLSIDRSLSRAWPARLALSLGYSEQTFALIAFI